MSNPIEDYLKGTKAVPLPPNSQQEAELYNSESEKAIEGQTESQTKLAIEINKDLEERYERKRRNEAEKALYESNQREAEREIEFNSRQRELDDLDDDIDQSEPDSNDDNYLEDSQFSGNYFEKPDENEPKETLGERIRSKYNSFRESASDTAENLASSFGESFGAAAGAAAGAASRFKRGDPIFSVQSPVRRGKNPYTRSISRAGRTISRPYIGGRFGDSFSLGASNTNPYYPVYPVNEGRQSVNNAQTMDMYLPNGEGLYDGEFSGRKAFKRSEFSDERERYDPFGFGSLSGDGFDNTGGFGSSLMGFGDSLLGGVGNSKESSIFGNGAMFNANRAKGKKEVSGFGLDMIIGDSGGMYNTTDPSPRKTTKRKSTSSKTTKKATKKPVTKRKVSTRKQTYTGFTLP